MRQRWKKSYYLSWLRADVFLKIVIISTQPTAHQKHLHTPYHIFFLPFFEHISHFVYPSLLFFFPSFLAHSPFLPWRHLRVLYTHACIHTHRRHNAHAHNTVCCTKFVDFPTNPQYLRRYDRAFNSSRSVSNSLLMQPTTVVYGAYCNLCAFKWVSGHWKPMNLFVRSLVYKFFYLISISCLLLSFQIATTATTMHAYIQKDHFVPNETHCNPL